MAELTSNGTANENGENLFGKQRRRLAQNFWGPAETKEIKERILGHPAGRYDVSLRDELTLRAEAIDFEGYVVYTGMILRKDHPEYDSLIEKYDEFVKRANKLYRIQPK